LHEIRCKILSEMFNKTVYRVTELHTFCCRIALSVLKYAVVRMLISVASERALVKSKSNDLLLLARSPTPRFKALGKSIENPSNQNKPETQY